MNLLTHHLPLIKKRFSAVSSVDENTSQRLALPLPAEQDLVRAGALLARERNFKDLVSVFVEQAQDISRADMSAFYIYKDAEDSNSDLKLVFKRGRYPVPEIIPGTLEIIRFLRECREAVIFNNKSVSLSKTPEKQEASEADTDHETPGFLKEVLINPLMKSGMALPVVSSPREIGVLFAGSPAPCFFSRRRFHFLDSYTKLAAGAMQNLLLLDEARESSRKIDSLERYQENVFNSMTNMVITTDASGHIYYFNEPAALAMGLTEDDLGRSLENIFRSSLSSKTVKTILNCLEEGSEIIGLEGIYRNKEIELDYSLNISPLKTPRGKKEGLTLLFTNQTRENELKQTVQAVSEDRRVIKDMFARYMSQEVMENLMDSPDSIKLGGDKRIATVFFADIRGYTSFSETREPEEIVEILNEYFSEAIHSILDHKGYIDKLIGDCIMAVWGVPMMPDKDDPYNAVSAAIEIQEMVRSAKRKFFRKDASRLRIGIGINTGPLVAGNLGSMQRMDYSVIGDTVNLAARLESIAGPDEIIVTQMTRNALTDKFKFEERPSVRVKGKDKPVKIYSVLSMK
jgi:PAS domain S-box-containing protein